MAETSSASHDARSRGVEYIASVQVAHAETVVAGASSEIGASTPDVDTEHELRAMLRREGLFGGARLLVSDSTALYLLLNEARGRVMQRMFGVPKNKSALVTLIALAALAQAIDENVREAMKGSAAPSQGDSLLGFAIVNEVLRGIAGAGSGDSAYFGPLVTIALVSASIRPAVRASLRGMKTVRADFDHRYGHLIRRNRPSPSSATPR